MKSETINKIFKAIADPTRREIFHLLVIAAGSLSINEIAEQFDISRQGITKHIQVLNQAGLVDIIPKGREKYCYANPRPLREIHDWVSHYEKFWDQKLHLLESFLREKGK